MKRILLSTMLLCGVMSSKAQWVSLNAPDSINYQHVQIHEDSQKIMAWGWVYNSTTFIMSNYYAGSSDGGSTWTVLPAESIMDAFWWNEYYYIHTFSGLKRSADMGASFENVITSPPGWGQVAVAGNGNLIIFNDMFDYPNYSTDGGFTWTAGTGLTPSGMNSWFVAADGTILAGLTDRVVYSTDNGVTWSTSTLDGSSAWPNLERKSISQSADGTLYQMEGGNVFNKSEDGGLSWTSVTPAIIMSTLLDAVCDGNTLVTIGIYDTYQSADGAVNFSTETGWQSNYDLELGHDGFVYLGRGGGIFKRDFSGNVGVDEIVSKNKSMNLYPNPVHNEFTLMLDQSHSEGILTIYAIDGTTVDAKKLSPEQFQIQWKCSELNSGAYVVTWQSADGKSMAYTSFIKY